MDCQKLQNNKHTVVVNTEDVDRVFQQIVLWGEAGWWPKNCIMRFMRMGNLPVQKGTMYRQRVLLPFAPNWLTVVTNIIEDKSISRRFLDGFLYGEETVSISPCQNRLKIEYLMNYRVRGRINNILWKLCFCNMHNRNIVTILNNLKSYLER